MKLGLNDSPRHARRLRLATYVDFNKLPAPPADFGHEDLIPEWGILKNDTIGDCAIAGPMHQIMLWSKEGGHFSPMSDDAAIANYSAVTGYNPNDPSTDQGTNIDQMAQYWQTTGLVDANGTAHKIVAFLDMNPGDLRELWTATYLFQSVGMGFDMPESAIEQTQHGVPWDDVGDDNIVGGHYVPAFARRSNLGVGVTWGLKQPFTAAFYSRYNRQGIVALDEEMLFQSKDIDGFDDVLLRQDLQAFSTVGLPEPHQFPPDPYPEPNPWHVNPKPWNK